MSDKRSANGEEQPAENNQGSNTEEEEPVYTGAELIAAMEDREEVERMLYGSQDGSVCTWPEGYKPRQPLFSCLTCNPTKDDCAGVCLGCSTHCHEDHELVELYTKRKFRCDCGNKKFSNNKCNLFEEKSELNEYNTYNHNFAGYYCKCGDTFPGESTELMFQCLLCEDWYHLTHLNVDLTSDKGVNIKNGYTLVCTDCTVKHPYLQIFENVDEKTCFLCKNTEVNKESVFALKPDWRKRICSCSNCQSVMEANDSTFLLDDDDDVEKYEKENKEKAAAITDADVVDQLVQLGGRDAAANVLRGFHELKSGLAQFFQAKANEVITTDDVHAFFSQIKRPRLDPETDE